MKRILFILVMIICCGYSFIAFAADNAVDEMPMKRNNAFLGWGFRYVDGAFWGYSGSRASSLFEIGYSRYILGSLSVGMGVTICGYEEYMTTNGPDGTSQGGIFEPFAGVHYDMFILTRRLNPFAETGVKYSFARIIDRNDQKKRFSQPGWYGSVGVSINFKYAKIMPLMCYSYVPVLFNGRRRNAGGVGWMIRGVFVF